MLSGYIIKFDILFGKKVVHAQFITSPKDIHFKSLRQDNIFSITIYFEIYRPITFR